MHHACDMVYECIQAMEEGLAGAHWDSARGCWLAQAPRSTVQRDENEQAIPEGTRDEDHNDPRVLSPRT